MPLPSTIAIDGPAASGKSTIGALLAERLGYVYFDTGVMYRAVTWAALQRGIPIEEEDAVTALSERLLIEVTRPTVDDGRQYTVLADGEDVTWDLRRPEVNQHVSPVSAYPGVRRALLAQQRRIGEDGSVVMVGRDIGTVVLPDADLKVYLDATVDERAWRRYVEVYARRTARQPERDAVSGDEYASIREGLARRDRIDSSREVAPLRAAKDAVVIDTTDMPVAEVLARVLALCNRERDSDR
ncbi:MAG: (d)CMP kinase [Anaerolineae bacterium]|nr:(d)CMP kinase [Anaerolineae bacterium]